MKRWLISVIVVFIVLLGIVAFGLYENGGGRYYWEMADSVNQKTGEEKTKLKKEVFGDSAENKYGGVFVRAMGEGFWIWGDKGLKYFRKQGDKTVFYFYDLCNKENLRRAQQGKDTFAAKDVYFDMAVWQKKMRQGDQVMVKYYESNKSLAWEVWGIPTWDFKFGSLAEKCAR